MRHYRFFSLYIVRIGHLLTALSLCSLVQRHQPTTMSRNILTILRHIWSKSHVYYIRWFFIKVGACLQAKPKVDNFCLFGVLFGVKNFLKRFKLHVSVRTCATFNDKPSYLVTMGKTRLG